MSDLIVLCALDRFGAEALGKVFDLDSMVRKDPRILWLWAGQEDPPEISFLDRQIWSQGKDALRLRIIPACPLSATFDRREFSDRVRKNAVAGFQHWNNELDMAKPLPDEKLAHLLMTGSMADPRTAVTAEGIFDTYCRIASLWGAWRLRGAWAIGRNTGGEELPEALRDACTAVSIRDLSKAIEAHAAAIGRDWLPVFPNYLIGSGDRLGDVLPTRGEASLLAALAILGSIHDIRGRLPRESLFAVRHEQDTRATWVGMKSFVPETPFAAIGGAVIRKSRELFLRACGTVLLRGILAQFQRQPEPEDDFGPPAPSGITTRRHLEDWTTNFLSLVSSELGKRGYRQPGSYCSPFSGEAIGRMVGWEAFRTTFSERIDDVFGWNSFSHRPLELWDQALQELDSTADRFFFVDRTLRLHQFLGATIESVDSAIRQRINLICVDSQSKESGAPFQPHILARAFTRTAREAMERLGDQDRKTREEEKRGLCSDDDVPEMESRLANRMAHLRKLVREVPSPLALLVRIIVLFAVFLFGFGVTEFPYYSQFTPQQLGLLRLGQALVVTMVVAGWVLFRALRLKAGLHKAFTQWFQLKLEYCKERHLRMELRTREDLFAAAGEYFRWLGIKPDTETWHPFHEFSHTTRYVAQVWPLQRTPLAKPELQEFLHAYPKQLSEAVEHCDKKLEGLVELFTECRREFLLPYINRGREGILKLGRLTAMQFPQLAEHPESAENEALHLIASVMASSLHDPDAPFLPYLGGARKAETTEWRGVMAGLPFVDKCEDADAGNLTLADRAVATLAEYLRTHPGNLEKTLPRWLLEDVFESTSWKEIPSFHTPIWKLINECKNPPHSDKAGRNSPLLELWSPGDNHFLESFDAGKTAQRYDMKIAEDINRPFYALLTLLPSLSANEAIFGSGDSANPDNLVGFHWLMFSKEQPLPMVLTPLSEHE